LPRNDEEIDRESGLSLFDAFGSPDKTLHTFPGSHFIAPVQRIDTRFFARHGGNGPGPSRVWIEEGGNSYPEATTSTR
jgi:hypothetical protein